MDISTLVIQNKKDRYILEMEYTENDDIKKEIQNIINKLVLPSESKITKFDDKINEIEELSMKKLFYRLKEPQKINRITKYFINNHKISEDKAELFSSQIMELLNKKAVTQRIPVRVGEKYHEVLINKHEIRNTYESKYDYIVYNFGGDGLDEKRRIPFKKAVLKEEYSSDVAKFFTKDELKSIITKEKILGEVLSSSKTSI